MVGGEVIEIVQRVLGCPDEVLGIGNEYRRSMNADLKWKYRSTGLSVMTYSGY
jgi:hypothetical protein